MAEDKDKIENNEDARRNNENQNKTRRRPYKKNSNKNAGNSGSDRKTAGADDKNKQVAAETGPGGGGRNNRSKKNGGSQRKRPRIHYDHDNIKMLRNNYLSNYAEDENPGYAGETYEDAGENRQLDSGDNNTGAVIGRNAVRELLKSNRSVDKLYVRRGDREGSIVVIVAEAVNRHVPVVEVDSSKLDMLSGGAPHQGVVAMAAEKEYTGIDDMLATAEKRGETPLIVIADEIADPYNLGALIRCAECAGAHGLVIPKRRAAGLTPVVTKASAGAIEHLAIAKVVNIGNTIDQLKKKGLWIYAADAEGTPYYETDFSSPAAVVFGSEGNGIGKLIISKCDFVVSIPMYGQVNSLNVSTAASVILSHAARMQRQK